MCLECGAVWKWVMLDYRGKPEEKRLLVFEAQCYAEHIMNKDVLWRVWEIRIFLENNKSQVKWHILHHNGILSRIIERDL